MRTTRLLVLLLLASAHPAYATFSIVAFDPATGEVGVAVGAYAFAASERVPFGQGGVGAIATQGNNNVGYHMRSLELLRSGLSARQVLDKLLAEDTFPGKDARQVAIVDAKGNIAIYQGASVPQPRGNREGQTYAVIGNNLIAPHVVEAMGMAFESAPGELAERLLVALKAGELAGGDGEPPQAAAILVFRANQFDNNDRYVAVRVDSHSDPIHELRRLLDLQLARNYAGARNYLVRSGKLTEALAAAQKAATYEPVVADHHLHLGFLAYLSGARGEALQSFKRARELNPNFKQAWDGMLANAQFAGYRRVRDDQPFVDSIMN
jgi:uncharacterized Ntn-hydrolase superfamily protein